MGRFCSCKHFCSSEPILDELGTSRLSVYHIGGKVSFAAFTWHGVEDFQSRRSLSLSYVPLSNTRLYLAGFSVYTLASCLFCFETLSDIHC